MGSPYATDGEIVLDLVEYGSALTEAAWCTLAQSSDIRTVSSTATVGSKSVDVTSSLVSVLDQRADLFQFRLQHQGPSSPSGYAIFEAGEAQSDGLAPRLEVSFTLPPPNLTPYRPAGWSDKIVVSKRTGTHTDEKPLFANDDLYVDLAVINDGPGFTTTQFSIELLLDGEAVASWVNEPPLSPSFFTSIEDFHLGTLPKGPHSLRLVVDPDSSVTETNESDNQFTRNIFVASRSPVARAGPDQSVREGSPVSLDGGASSDPDPEDTLSFSWTQTAGPPVSLSRANSAVASFIAPHVEQPTLLSFRLTVSDGQRNDSDTVNVTVTGNRPPVANAGPDQTVVSGQSVVISGSGFDPDGDGLTFSWSQLQGPQVSLTGANSPTLSFTAPHVTNATTLSFNLELSDGSRNSSDEVTVVVVSGKSTSLIFPQFVNGQTPPTAQLAASVSPTENRTRIVLRNNNDHVDTGRIQFRDASGNPIEVPINGVPTHTYRYSVEAWKTIEVETDGTGAFQTGVIEVVSDLGPQSRVHGTEIFEFRGSFVSVDNAPPRIRQQAYVSVTAEENTGVALHNPHNTASVTVDLILVSGEEQARKQLTLGPLEQLVALIDEEALFRDFLESVDGVFKGTLNVHATGDGVSILGLIQKRATGALIAVSATEDAFTPDD